MEYKYYKIVVDVPLIGERAFLTYRSPFLFEKGDLVLVPVGKGDRYVLGVVISQVNVSDIENTDHIKDIGQVYYRGLFPHWYVDFVLDISIKFLLSPFDVFLISYDKTIMDMARIRVLLYTGKECKKSRSKDFNEIVSQLKDRGYIVWKDIKKLFGKKAGRLWRSLKDKGCGVEVITPIRHGFQVTQGVWIVCDDREYPLKIAIVSWGKKVVSKLISKGKCKLVYYLPTKPVSIASDSKFVVVKGDISDLIDFVKNEQGKGNILVITRNRTVAIGLAKKMVNEGITRVISPTLSRRNVLYYILTGDNLVFVLPTGYLFKPWNNLSTVIFYDVDDISIILRNGALLEVPAVLETLKKYISSIIYISPFPRIGLVEMADTVYDSLHIDNISIVEKPRDALWSRSVFIDLHRIVKDGGRVLIYASRLGYKTAVLCRRCGYIQRCPICGFTMVYHLKENKMVCHRCGYSEKAMEECPKCGSLDIVMVGSGIELLEEELVRLFGDKLCVESSIHRRRCNKDKQVILATFRFYRYFVGDQFDMVYVPDIDFLWSLPHYDVWEQMLRMVYRMSIVGKTVVVATNVPHVWRKRLSESYMDFVKKELNERKVLFFPPSKIILNLVYTSTSYKDAQDKAHYIVKVLSDMDIGDVWPPEFTGRSSSYGLYSWLIRVSLYDHIDDDLLVFLEKTRPFRYYLSVL